MSTQTYYKNKLGFDPRDEIYNDGPPQKYMRTNNDKHPDKHSHGYEENLTKFKGTIWDLFIESTSGTVEGFGFSKFVCQKHVLCILTIFNQTFIVWFVFWLLNFNIIVITWYAF